MFLISTRSEDCEGFVLPKGKSTTGRQKKFCNNCTKNLIKVKKRQNQTTKVEKLKKQKNKLHNRYKAVRRKNRILKREVRENYIFLFVIHIFKKK